jgi:hypothetical protein
MRCKRGCDSALRTKAGSRERRMSSSGTPRRSLIARFKSLTDPSSATSTRSKPSLRGAKVVPLESRYFCGSKAPKVSCDAPGTKPNYHFDNDLITKVFFLKLALDESITAAIEQTQQVSAKQTKSKEICKETKKKRISGLFLLARRAPIPRRCHRPTLTPHWAAAGTAGCRTNPP